MESCAFCGCVTVYVQRYTLPTRYAYTAWCFECHAEGPRAYSEADAIAKWNSRCRRAVRCDRGEQTDFRALAVRVLRQHRRCGDAYPEDGWPEVNAALARYALEKRYPREMS